MLRLLRVDMDLLGELEEIRVHGIFVRLEFTDVILYLVLGQISVGDRGSGSPLPLLVNTLTRRVRGRVLQRLAIIGIRITSIPPDLHGHSRSTGQYRQDKEQSLDPKHLVFK